MGCCALQVPGPPAFHVVPVLHLSRDAKLVEVHVVAALVQRTKNGLVSGYVPRHAIFETQLHHQ